MTEQRYFEDVDLGDEFAEEQQPTAEHVQQFFNIARLDGRPGRDELGDGRFTSTEGARQLGLERPIVPGTMSMAMITRLVTDWMGPRGKLQFIDVSFRRPVQHDDR
jgi:acyl dehydratase